ncbi:MAG: hypothetical protein GX545_08960 [Fibrobacter sp.]|jgi:flagellar biogenesis protein FliO|nr:hypothetical protein [Fibrobacter sp.]
MVVKKKSKQEIPSWHRKAQKAYRVNRVVIFLQMIAALVLTLVIWFGVAKVIH